MELVCECVMINDTIAQVIESQNTGDFTLNVIKVNVWSGLMLEMEMWSRNSSISCIALTQN